MRIGNRLFPYPTLNNDSSISEYEADSVFKLCFDTNESGELPHNSKGQLLRNVYFHLTDDGLKKLYDNEQIKCGLVIESSASTYRVMHYLSPNPQTIELQNQNLKGSVNVSAYLYATEDIEGYTNPKFKSDYKPYKFDIEKYDILAIDDGFRFQVNVDPSLDNKVASIFTIVPKVTDQRQMEYTVESNNIVIALPEEYYIRYDNIKGKADFNNMMFAMIAIPALAGALSIVKDNLSQGQEIDDVTEKYRWFRSVCSSYKKVCTRDLTSEEFSDLDPVVLAQIVLNDATCNGIEEISEHLLRGKDREENDDDE